MGIFKVSPEKALGVRRKREMLIYNKLFGCLTVCIILVIHILLD